MMDSHPILEDTVTNPSLQPQQPPTSIPAGWYPDPQQPNLQRWWDGNQWTEHLASIGPAATGSGSLYNEARDLAAGKNSPATWSLVMGLLGLFLGLMPSLVWNLVSFSSGAAAIIWAVIGLNRAQRVNRGRGLAIAGLVIGIFVVLADLVGISILYV
ncbi:DUF2510 domain-containing protein [Microbacterium tumbae]